jgi:hypothetical protein
VATRLGAKSRQAYRQPATFDPDQEAVYEGGMPAAQHQAIRTLARTTTHIERVNNTWRQRLSRLGREAWSFSQQLANPIGAIQALHRPLQPDASCGVQPTLYGYHLPYWRMRVGYTATHRAASPPSRTSGRWHLRVDRDWDARLDRLQLLTKLLSGEVQVVRLLQVEPQLGASAEPAAQP